jgi:DNA-binding ferritin-like protein
MHREAQEHEADTVEMLQWLLACLRAQYWMYQQSHWQVMGPEYYGNHLLFERLYESVVKQVDTLAEKMVAMYGADAVDAMDLGAKFEAWLRRWDAKDCLHMRGLMAEQDFQSAAQRVYEALGERGDLTLGMDDFLMATANEHETNEYLLRQVLRSKESARTAAADWAELARKE